jgi:hypothetical protein
VFEDQGDVAGRRAALFPDDLLGPPPEGFSHIRVLKPLINLVGQFFGVGDYSNGVGLAKAIHHLGKIARKWAYYNRFGQGRRLDHIAAVLARAQVDQ